MWKEFRFGLAARGVVTNGIRMSAQDFGQGKKNSSATPMRTRPKAHWQNFGVSGAGPNHEERVRAMCGRQNSKDGNVEASKLLSLFNSQLPENGGAWGMGEEEMPYLRYKSPDAAAVDMFASLLSSKLAPAYANLKSCLCAYQSHTIRISHSE
ncbi:hypothetical protein VMCG_01095 [Cytospora schulzeri]|uniref:Uncharacterized protein n=1 Tax=Cytospora schulzeri TaxID=448051 RepID=A0A423X5L3_9PEZI|nr:hypothetical protein VMCG_01095 [Valsa malicola]